MNSMPACSNARDGNQVQEGSLAIRRAPPPPSDLSQESEKQIETDKLPGTHIQKTDLTSTARSSVEVSGADKDKRDHENHLDPETILDLFDSALCCALDLSTLEEIVDDFAERLIGLTKDHQKQAQKIIDRHHRRVEDLDQNELSSNIDLKPKGELRTGLKSLLPHLGLGRRPSMRRRERVSGRLSRSLASWNARQPLISKYVDQFDDEATSLEDQNSEMGE